MSLSIRLSCVAQLRAQEAIAATSGSSGSTVATGDAVTFAAIGLHDYTMQKRLDSDRAHQQPRQIDTELRNDGAEFSIEFAV